MGYKGLGLGTGLLRHPVLLTEPIHNHDLANELTVTLVRNALALLERVEFCTLCIHNSLRLLTDCTIALNAVLKFDHTLFFSSHTHSNYYL